MKKLEINEEQVIKLFECLEEYKKISDDKKSLFFLSNLHQFLRF